MKKVANNLKKKKLLKFLTLSLVVLIQIIVFSFIAYDSFSINNTEIREVQASIINNEQGELTKFKLKIANTPYLRQKGLMFVKSLSDNEGMIFVYDEDIVMNFWMKNTFIPLDILFLNKNYQIVGIIENMIPQGGNDTNDDNLPRYSINRKSRFAIEIPAFSVKKYSIKVGDRVNILN